MPISCECPSCGKRLKAPDSAAGKRALCPKCRNPVQIPTEIIHDAEEVTDTEQATEAAAAVPEDEYGLANVGAEPAGAAPPEPERRPCPACGEMIAVAAVKCRYCGEIVNAAYKTQVQGRSRTASAADEQMEPIDWLLCLLCSGIGCIVSIIYLIQGKPKAGKMLAISVGMILFWNVALGILGGILEQLGKNG